MSISLRRVTLANRGDLEDIDPGEQQRYWVHSNWYWHQQSLDNPTITFRLVHLDGVSEAVGMVAYGRHYEDEALTWATPGRYEIHHLVIDRRFQRRGIGRETACEVLTALRTLPDCRVLVVATHPDNDPSATLFRGLGFVPTGERNYDGDPILELALGQ